MHITVDYTVDRRGMCSVFGQTLRNGGFAACQAPFTRTGPNVLSSTPSYPPNTVPAEHLPGTESKFGGLNSAIAFERKSGNNISPSTRCVCASRMRRLRHRARSCTPHTCWRTNDLKGSPCPSQNFVTAPHPILGPGLAIPNHVTEVRRAALEDNLGNPGELSTMMDFSLLHIHSNGSDPVLEMATNRMMQDSEHRMFCVFLFSLPVTYSQGDALGLAPLGKTWTGIDSQVGCSSH